MDLLQRYKDLIKSNGLFHLNDTLLLAVSGGLDSVVLCELTRQAGYDFVIAHCNFKLRGKESERDKEFVNKLAKHYNVDFIVRDFDTENYAAANKLSIQEAARKLRYDWFEQILTSHLSALKCLVTAHHADDNIETVMMNFFRGTGIKGLRGMEEKQGKIVRPLLFARRRELEEFAKENNLNFVTDSSNFKDEYTRNFLRLNVIPMLEKVFPQVTNNLLFNIDRFRDVEMLYDQSIEWHKKNLFEYKGEEIHIPVLKLKKITPLRSVVYEISKEQGFSPHQVDDIIRLLDSDTGKYICSSTHRVLKNRNWLIFTPLAATSPEIILIENGPQNIQFFSGGNKKSSLQFESIPNFDFAFPDTNNIACFDASEIVFPLILRKWKAGDYFYPLGMKKQKKLARFFIDQKLSKPDKEKIWVLEMNKKIVWVIGYRIDDRFKITGHTKSILKVTCTTSQTE
ncbi:MAG: tRNA lysidine(34) synthetase TilS [Bacteroidetes bacterium]|nr:tRNA lysidine(34) synthetase TilS [Bacteroidota bacterium]MBS1930645.1 tRNA lysidine(34) synthetase TilS [Bacteroidota bacterium]